MSWFRWHSLVVTRHWGLEPRKEGKRWILRDLARIWTLPLLPLISSPLPLALLQTYPAVHTHNSLPWASAHAVLTAWDTETGPIHMHIPHTWHTKHIQTPTMPPSPGQLLTHLQASALPPLSADGAAVPKDFSHTGPDCPLCFPLPQHCPVHSAPNLGTFRRQKEPSLIFLHNSIRVLGGSPVGCLRTERARSVWQDSPEGTYT